VGGQFALHECFVQVKSNRVRVPETVVRIIPFKLTLISFGFFFSQKTQHKTYGAICRNVQNFSF
jgi:hypothetical protein